MHGQKGHSLTQRPPAILRWFHQPMAQRPNPIILAMMLYLAWFFFLLAAERTLYVLRRETKVTAVRFSNRGDALAISVFNKPVRLFDLPSGRERFILRDQWGTVSAFAFAPDDNTLASGVIGRRTGTGTVTLWQTRTGKKLHHLNASLGWVRELVFAPNGKTLLTVGEDSQLKMWDVNSGQEFKTLRITDVLDESPVRSAAISPDCEVLAAGTKAGTLYVWNLTTDQLRSKAHVDQGPIQSLAFSPDGTNLAIVTEYSLKLWDLTASKGPNTLAETEHPVSSIAFAPDGKRFAVGSANGTIQIFDAATGRRLLDRQDRKYGLLCLDFAPDGTSLATGGWDKTVKILDLTTGQSRYILRDLRPFVVRWSLIGLALVGLPAAWLIARGCITRARKPRSPQHQDTQPVR